MLNLFINTAAIMLDREKHVPNQLMNEKCYVYSR